MERRNPLLPLFLIQPASRKRTLKAAACTSRGRPLHAMSSYRSLLARQGRINCSPALASVLARPTRLWEVL
jgi:hypothetical protein